MNNIMHFTPKTGVKDTLLPFLDEHLPTVGWVLVKLQPSDKIETDMLLVAALAGQILGNDFGYHVLDTSDANEVLALHTEGISNEYGVIPYFALGCIKPSVSGGQTRLFDGRIAANKIAKIPELSHVLIEYSALANPQSRIQHPLVIPEHGGTVRYRSRVETNKVINPGGFSDNEMYRRVDEAIHSSLIVSHEWGVGDLLFVNNFITLHDRLPFVGRRRMLRVRYNDSLNFRVRY